MTGDRGLAEEIAQDVFLELDGNMNRIESPQHACFWLRRVTMSLWLTRFAGVEFAALICGWRSKRITAHRPKSAHLPWTLRLEQLLTTLPEPQRAALVLRYQEDLSPEEIAAALDSPLATIKSNLQRGLKLLRAKATCHLKEYIRGT